MLRHLLLWMFVLAAVGCSGPTSPTRTVTVRYNFADGPLGWAPGFADYRASHAYLLVPDAAAVHERVCRAGAEILLELKDTFYGGRGFTCRDPEGHIWSIGTYDPWKVASS